MRYVFDIETNGFLEDLDRVHSLVIKDIDTGSVMSCTDSPYTSEEPGITTSSIEDGLHLLSIADEIIGHNIIKFDVPAIQKVYPWFKPKGTVTDTLVISRLIWPELRETDLGLRRKNPTFLGNLLGSHSLEAWGLRLGFPKDDYSKRCKEQGIDPWAAWSVMMQTYCEQDVAVTSKFYELIRSKNYDERAIMLEHAFQKYIWMQEQSGYPFDVAAAERLYNTLATRREQISKQLETAFAPWWTPGGIVAPKRTVNFKDPLKASTVADCPYSKVTLTHFNPNSRDHVANRLIAIHGWEPKEFTPDGRPKIDDTVLSELDYPEARLLAESFMIQKRIGQLAEGAGAWLKLVKNGRIHGRVNTNGAVTGRCTHHSPNMGQVPSVSAPFGAACRALFHAPAGYKNVGADASGLELRCLAHYMARFDDGLYTKALLEGDIHWTNAQALGLVGDHETFDAHNETHLWARNKVSKRFIYAYLYGAGDEKIGSITGGGAKEGKKLKATFLAKTPALKHLKDNINAVVKQRKYLIGLDGRRLHVRSQHAALNTLLQSAGALIVKQATVIFCDDLLTRGYEWDRDFAMVAHVHDEMQVIAKEVIADEVGQRAVAAFTKAGEVFNFRCRIDGEYKVGANWKETH